MGLTFLSRHIVTMNFPKGVMYLKQFPDAPMKNFSEDAQFSTPSLLSN